MNKVQSLRDPAELRWFFARGAILQAAAGRACWALCAITVASTLLASSYAAEEPATQSGASNASKLSNAPGPSGASASAPALNAADAAAVQALREFLTRSTSAQGDFEQRIVRDGAGKDAVSRGRFKFQRPGRYAWLTDQPYPQSILSDGRTLQVFDPALNQLTLRPVPSGDAAPAAGTPVDLLFGRLPPGHDPLTAWRIRTVAPPPGARRYEPASAAWRWIGLEPRQLASGNNESTPYQNVVLGLAAGVPQWLSFDDAMSQHLQIRLRWQPTAKLTATDFRLDPPAGVEVIDLRPAH